MKSWFTRIILILILVAPAFVFADCSDKGYTVIFVNGIFGDENQAKQERSKLQDALGATLKNQSLIVRLGYNPSHLLGSSDITESFLQAFNTPISDYDLDTILDQVHSELTTQKVLLVGHSQGAFYTNEMYDYLVSHGIPKSSIAVYELATPATFVAGGGQYLNSYNDKVINAMRESEVSTNLTLDAMLQPGVSIVGSALRANIAIPREAGWDQNPSGGHIFSTYLSGAGPQIVQGISAELANLKTNTTPNVAAGDGCFTPPPTTVARVAETAFFTVTDPISGTISTTGRIAEGGVLALVNGVGGAFASLGQFFGVAPSALGQSAAAAPALDTVQASDEMSSQTAPNPPVDSQQQDETIAPRAIAQSVPATSKKNSSSTALPGNTPATSMATPSSGGTSPGFGGGGSSSNSEDSQSNSQQSGGGQQNSNASGGGGGGGNQSQQQSPGSVAFAIRSPSDGAAFATTTVVFSGTADAGALITATIGADSTSTVADNAGAWSLVFDLPEGSATIDFTAASSSGVTATASHTIAVDLTPPDPPIVSAAACTNTLASFGCIVATTTVDLAWDSPAGASYYAVAKNGALSATSTVHARTITLQPSATTTLAVVAYDAAGNLATSSALEIAAFTQPVIISEIIWAGTDTDPSDSMIELQNLTPFPIDLSKLSLTRSGGSPIVLSGIIDPSTSDFPFYLFNRTPLNTNLSGQLASRQTSPVFDQFSPTNPEQLSLVWSGTTIDTTPAPGACGGAWCAGSALTTVGSNVGGYSDVPTPLSMERKPGTVNGADPSSWQTSSYYPMWLSDFGGGVPVTWGTPDAKSSWQLPDAGVYCGAHTNLVLANQPFDFGNGDCTYLSRFISLNAFRSFALLRGDVGSSTLRSMHDEVHLIASAEANSIPADVQPGEHFFFLIFERARADDELNFEQYFLQGIGAPPHGNYAIFPFTYQPGATH